MARTTDDYPITAESVLLTLEKMGECVRGPFSSAAQRLALQYLIDRLDCPICGAGAAQWCYTYGWTNAVLRTHTARLQLTNVERRRAVAWALREERRRAVDGQELQQ